MNLIVAVYADWGIGKDGTQPIALSADRKFFRETTRGATVIVGRRTTEDFPGQKPLPGRKNIVLSRSGGEIPGFVLCDSPEKALQMTENDEKVFVIGGGSIYRQMMAHCDTAYITKLSIAPESDTFFPNLDTDPQWKLAQVVQSGEENGIAYQMCRYEKASL
jgi:dihydrofolate reductase